MELQQSEKLLTKERDRLQKELEVVKAGVGDEGVNASYMETMKAGYEEQIKEMNDQVLELQTAMMQSKHVSTEKQSTIEMMEGERKELMDSHQRERKELMDSHQKTSQ